MSRFKRFQRAALTSYAAQALNAIFALVSVPLALKYLSTEEYGLWALATQVAGYLQLLDMGARYAISRTLVDHKDNPGDGRYGAVIKAGLLVGVIQGVIVLVLGFSILGWLAGFLRVPPSLAIPFFWLLSYQFIVVGISFLTRVFPQILTAWQRTDLANYGQIAQNVIWPLGLWIFFRMGWGIYAAVISHALGWLCAAAVTALATFRLRFWPKAGQFGKISWGQFRELFRYSTDVFLISLGSQIILTGQSLLVTRLMDFSALATWHILSRTFGMISQVIFGTIASSMPAFAEMEARQETERLWIRYRTLHMTATAGTAALMVCFAVCNRSFVLWWTSGTMNWSQINDMIMAGWILLLTFQCAHNSMLLCLKKSQALSYVYLVEGLVFVGAAWILIPRAGFTGLLAGSFVCTLVFTYAFGFWRLNKLARDQGQPGLWRWHLPALKAILIMAPAGLVLNWIFQPLGPLPFFLATGTLLALTAGMTLLGFALPRDVAAEVASRLPTVLRPWALRLAARNRSAA